MADPPCSTSGDSDWGDYAAAGYGDQDYGYYEPVESVGRGGTEPLAQSQQRQPRSQSQQDQEGNDTDLFMPACEPRYGHDLPASMERLSMSAMSRPPQGQQIVNIFWPPPTDLTVLRQTSGAPVSPSFQRVLSNLRICGSLPSMQARIVLIVRRQPLQPVPMSAADLEYTHLLIYRVTALGANQMSLSMKHQGFLWKARGEDPVPKWPCQTTLTLNQVSAYMTTTDPPPPNALPTPAAIPPTYLQNVQGMEGAQSASITTARGLVIANIKNQHVPQCLQLSDTVDTFGGEGRTALLLSHKGPPTTSTVTPENIWEGVQFRFNESVNVQAKGFPAPAPALNQFWLVHRKKYPELFKCVLFFRFVPPFLSEKNRLCLAAFLDADIVQQCGGLPGGRMQKLEQLCAALKNLGHALSLMYHPAYEMQFGQLANQIEQRRYAWTHFALDYLEYVIMEVLAKFSVIPVNLHAYFTLDSKGETFQPIGVSAEQWATMMTEEILHALDRKANLESSRNFDYTVGKDPAARCTPLGFDTAAITTVSKQPQHQQVQQVQQHQQHQQRTPCRYDFLTVYGIKDSACRRGRGACAYRHVDEYAEQGLSFNAMRTHILDGGFRADQTQPLLSLHRRRVLPR